MTEAASAAAAATVTPPAALVCTGCGHRVPDDAAFVARCPAARDGDDIDHVLRRELDLAPLAFPDGEEPAVFVRYRTLLRAWHLAKAAGFGDARFVDLVRRLDDAVAAVDGRGFRETPFEPAPGLAAAVGLTGGALWVKDETHNVSGSHKARHLMGVLLELLVAEALGTDAGQGRLAIASCGNAALAAAVVARAAGRDLDVFVPDWADEAVVDRLLSLGATVAVCAREPGETGDPTYRRLREAIVGGAIPFTCQGNENGLAIEGGETLAYEMAAQLGRRARGSRLDASVRLDAVVVQVGGGALGSAVASGFAEAHAFGALEREPRLYCVQTEGCAPLARAWRAVQARAAEAGMPAALAHARTHRSQYMRPWEAEPASAAHGILDDETYDWFALVEAMARTGGDVVVVDEATVLEANELGVALTGIGADHTGTAGLAGLLALTRSGLIRPDEVVAVLFTGARRHGGRGDASTAAPLATTRPEERRAR